MSITSTVKPNPPLNVSLDSKSSRVVNISWIAGFDGNNEIQNYTVKRSIDNQEFVDAVCQGSLSDSSCVVTSTNASLENLSPGTTYYFKVFARNVVGTSDGSPVVNATTDEEGALHVYKQCSCFNICIMSHLSSYMQTVAFILDYSSADHLIF